MWLADLISECRKVLGDDATVFIDCNPSFAAYTELSILASDRLIIPCSSDGSSARAIDNVGALVYGHTKGKDYGPASFANKARANELSLPQIHSVLLNRSTQYSNRASKAFAAMFDAIKDRTDTLGNAVPEAFIDGRVNFLDMPDSHSVAIVCSHLGRPLYTIRPGQYPVHDENPQVNDEPLDRYKKAVDRLIKTL